MGVHRKILTTAGVINIGRVVINFVSP